MFKVKNLRNGDIQRLKSSEFKSKIIAETGSRYENLKVTPERTGLRPESLQPLFDELDDLNNFIVLKNVYLISAVSRVNANINSRYMILIDGDDYNPNIVKLINDFIPIYSVEIKDSSDIKGQASTLSSWFRNTMGRAFSFVDIDYLVINSDFNKVVIIEEKIETGPAGVGYGQKISYKELVTDVLKVKHLLLFIFSIKDADITSKINFFTCNSYTLRTQHFNITDEKSDTIKGLANKISNYLLTK